uniref:Uncharacterized protein n=1 Tax=Corethron hystrix TaxID=216773 RepID=A0A7S1BGP6_9STRA|mmetsp:Transcript_26938/g.62003  ORF Transcript_26938/g.62003 Transcript_26938/m.62003 type:complete len:622 (+) Transcript_26938:77-1942(+)
MKSKLQSKSIVFGLFSVSLLTTVEGDQNFRTRGDALDVEEQRNVLLRKTATSNSLDDDEVDNFFAHDGYSYPVTSPSAWPTTIPSNLPTKYPMASFKGINSVYSSKKGEINVSWLPLVSDGDPLEDDVIYDIFVADTPFDFESYLKEFSVDDLIIMFDSEFKHYSEYGNRKKIVYNKSIQSESYGKIHTLLITAKLNDVYSTNTSGLEVRVAISSPKERWDANIVGLFIPPKDGWKIEIDNESKIVEFKGESLPSEAKALEDGDYISGITPDYGPFCLKVAEVLDTYPCYVKVRTEVAHLEDMYESFSLDGYFDPANDIVESDIPEATQRNSLNKKYFPNEKYVAVNRRRLFWDAAWNNFVGVVDNIIGDIDYFNTEGDHRFLIDYWQKPIDQKVAENVHLKGLMDFSNIKLRLQIDIDKFNPKLILAGIKADYVLKSNLDLSEGSFDKEKDIKLWDGEPSTKTIMVGGVVPIVLDWTPKFYLTPKVEGSWDSPSEKLTIHLEGWMKFVAKYKENGFIFTGENNLEESIADFDNEGKGTLDANIGLKLNLELNAYKGLIQLNGAFIAGLGFEVASEKTPDFANEGKPKFYTEFKIPLSVTALYGAILGEEEEFFNKKYISS